MTSTRSRAEAQGRGLQPEEPTEQKGGASMTEPSTTGRRRRERAWSGARSSSRGEHEEAQEDMEEHEPMDRGRVCEDKALNR